MQKSLGEVIRTAREKRHLDREALAKKLKITPAYLSHLENNAPVYFSERIVLAMNKILDLSERTLRHYARLQNQRAYLYKKDR